MAILEVEAKKLVSGSQIVGGLIHESTKGNPDPVTKRWSVSKTNIREDGTFTCVYAEKGQAGAHGKVGDDTEGNAIICLITEQRAMCLKENSGRFDGFWFNRTSESGKVLLRHVGLSQPNLQGVDLQKLWNEISRSIISLSKQDDDRLKADYGRCSFSEIQ